MITNELSPALAGGRMNCPQLLLGDYRFKFRRAFSKNLLIILLLIFYKISAKAIWNYFFFTG